MTYPDRPEMQMSHETLYTRPSTGKDAVSYAEN
jgi:hypothetical protein